MKSAHFRFQPVIVLVVFALVAGSLIVLHKPREVVMTRTDRGWVPKTITISQGDTVIFKTDTGKEFWPASDFHPSHTLYPEFDSKRPVPPDEEWRFTFERIGVWTLHDHLAAEFKGAITVRGASGQTRQECLSKIPAHPELGPACWLSEIIGALKSGGLSKAYDVFDVLYQKDPMFQQKCHDVSHALGSEAYSLFSSNHQVVDRPETAYCGYGFYHGFIETMYVAEGPMHLGAAREYCEALQATSGEGASGPCFHGIGHAVFDSLDSTLWGDEDKMTDAALLMCETVLAKEPDRILCSTGVYNALGNAISARTYNLSHETVDIIPLCLAQKKEYQDGCIVQAGIGYIRYKNMDRAEAIRFVEALGPALAPSGILTYIDNEVLMSIKTFDAKAYRDTCLSFPNETYRQSCIHGVISALRNLGDPHTEYIPMFEFCDLFAPGESRTACYRIAIQQTGNLNKENRAFQAACKSIREADVSKLCR